MEKKMKAQKCFNYIIFTLYVLETGERKYMLHNLKTQLKCV